MRPAVAGILEVEDAGKRHLPLDQPLDRAGTGIRRQGRAEVDPFVERRAAIHAEGEQDDMVAEVEAVDVPGVGTLEAFL